MFASVFAGLTSATLSVFSSILTKRMFESLVRKTLIAVITKVVASTENKVDDDMVAPILKELKGLEK